MYVVLALPTALCMFLCVCVCGGGGGGGGLPTYATLINNGSGSLCCVSLLSVFQAIHKQESDVFSMCPYLRCIYVLCPTVYIAYLTQWKNYVYTTGLIEYNSI